MNKMVKIIIGLIIIFSCLNPTNIVAGSISFDGKGDMKAMVDEIKEKTQAMDIKTNKKVDIDVDINIPIPTPYPPYPQYPPYPYPQPGYQQNIINFESGEFNFASDAEDSFNAALQQLRERGYTILETRINWNRYVINFIAPNKRVERYISGQYNFIGDAEDALESAVSSLKAKGYVVLEKRINSNRVSFTISYLINYYSPVPVINFVSGKFNFASDAEDSFNLALFQLKERGYTILESRLDWNKYIINFIAPNKRVERYVSGQYNFTSDAEESLESTVNSLKSKGYVVLEKRINSDRHSFTISYLVSEYSPYPGPYNPLPPTPSNPYPNPGTCGTPTTFGTPYLGGGCNVHGCWLPGGGCNVHGCWPAGGSCNVHGCSAYGECNVHGCPAPIAGESKPCKR
jgi:hypothetical protein